MSATNQQVVVENPFLEKLLTLQQDGKAAISAPSTWKSPPLLRVETDLDRVVGTVFESICESDKTGCARWQFFVGSPGNGKSAGTGELVQNLMGAGFVVKDVEGTLLQDLNESAIPYELQVYAPKSDHACALIVQDASVVPNPYASDANPAAALTSLLKQAAQKGVSLVVCTNRGVLERAFAANYLDPAANSEVWFAAVRASVMGEKSFKRDFEGPGRRSYKSVMFEYTSLDRRSLVIGRPTLDHLLGEAVNQENWSPCSNCPAQSRCPFYQNRQWLSDTKLRASFIQAIGYAEVLSGQVVVFREALALISLILAGCPHDYPDGSPCRWVHEQLDHGNLFSLLSRRLYMTLFSAYAPLGLESCALDRRGQKEALRKLADTIRGADKELCKRALRGVLAAAPPISSDVGVERLVGAQGVFRSVDPFLDVQANEFHERWSDNESPFLSGSGAWISELERSCGRVWKALADTAEVGREGFGGAYGWLTRWITAFTHRAGALVEEALTFSTETNDLVKILSITDQPREHDLRLIEKIQTELRKLLHAGGEGTEISPFARLKGVWVETKLRPKIDAGPNRGPQSIVLQLKFGDDIEIPLNAMAFVWLKRRVDRGMSDASFPNEYLETAGDALVRAASESEYYLEDSDVELVVLLPDGRKVSMKRSNGRVLVDGF